MGTKTQINNNQVFFGCPQRVWESKFPVGNSFLLRGTEKKTQTLKWSGTKQAFWKIKFIFQNTFFLNPKTSPKPSQNLPRSSQEPSQTLPNRPKIESRSLKNGKTKISFQNPSFLKRKMDLKCPKSLQSSPKAAPKPLQNPSQIPPKPIGKRNGKKQYS